MRVYETTFIINPQTDDATIDQHVSSVSALIVNAGGKLLHEDRMGTRRLAYPINKLNQGYYHSFIYEAPNEFLPTLERHFRLNDQYLRFLTLLFEGDVNKLTHERRERAEAEAEGYGDRRPARPRDDDSDDRPRRAKPRDDDDDDDSADVLDDSDDDEEV